MIQLWCELDRGEWEIPFSRAKSGVSLSTPWLTLCGRKALLASCRHGWKKAVETCAPHLPHRVSSRKSSVPLQQSFYGADPIVRHRDPNIVSHPNFLRWVTSRKLGILWHHLTWLFLLELQGCHLRWFLLGKMFEEVAPLLYPWCFLEPQHHEHLRWRPSCNEPYL